MILTKVLASYTFRFMSLYVAALSIAGLLVSTAIYTVYTNNFFYLTSESLDAEMQAFETLYREEGVVGVESYVEKTTHIQSFESYFYLIVDSEYQKITGNMAAWTPFKQYGDDWLSFQIDLVRGDPNTTEQHFWGLSRTLDNGNVLLVARDYRNVIYTMRVVTDVVIRSMIITITLGILGGAAVAALSVYRVDKINQSVGAIMTSGDLSQRIDRSSHQGDFRELTTNLNRMLDRIEMLMEGMRQVSDNIAHDLRTPLTRLRNNLAKLEDLPGGERDTIGQDLTEEADNILSTFNALLRIARVEAGNQRAGFKNVDIKVILLDVIELYEPLMAAKSIVLYQKLDTSLMINGDRHLLFQAFANLLDNAIKYTLQGGEITVALDVVCASGKVSIADTGIGIADSEKPKVFRRFFRVEASRSLQRGNGLGLSLVAAVVSLHKGEIDLADADPGLLVTVDLPGIA